MTKTVENLADYVIKEALANDLDIADIVNTVRANTLLGVEAEEAGLQARLLQLRTLKIKLNKI